MAPRLLRGALYVSCCSLLLLSGCSRSNQGPVGEQAPGNQTMKKTRYEVDPHSFSRPNEVAVRRLELDLAVDFAGKTLAGKARLYVENRNGARQLVLDTRDLDIKAVNLDDGQLAQYRLGPAGPVFMGQPLSIEIQPGTKFVDIEYSTSPQAAALQWLAPAQTAGGKSPYLYTQSQSILARTWVPCQDTPGVRMTYHARIKVPPGLMALMSAENPMAKRADGIYEFEMARPIPSYLLALAVGDLEFRAISPRAGVYAEPSVVDKAAWEFADTEKMMQAAERLYGPYRWGRYDVLVLPPSFPFGGMENPRLTFVTPTVLAGDRSLVSLVAHELAHSWSGNLVTNATWNDFWLNEGVTTYIEHRIMEELYGVDYERMLAVLGKIDLERDFKDLGGPESRATWLYQDLAGRDPDEGATEVPYEKGRLFLQMLEQAYGRPKWDQFLRGYFDHFAFQSMTTKEFLQYLDEHLVKSGGVAPASLQISAWVYGPGLPSNAPEFHSKALEQVKSQADAWLAGKPVAQIDTKGWTTQHWLYFLRCLPERMTRGQMAGLDSSFRFSETGNSEILNEWLMHVVDAQYQPAYPALERFLLSQGRRKFLKPLYTKLAATPQGLKFAREIYQRARPTYHAVSANTIDGILKWREVAKR
jgi:leukotriene-A4 hydrolase